MSLAARAMFTARTPWVKKRLQQMWRHAVEIGAYMTVLARLSSTFDGSKSLLAGLLHEIGAVPILTLADRYAELEQTPGIVDSVLANVVPEFSSHILKLWGLDDFSDAALHQENWFYEHDGEPDYTDLLVVAHLYSLIKARRFSDLPQLSQTAPYGRLMQYGLSATTSVTLLDDAQQDLQELRALLG